MLSAMTSYGRNGGKMAKEKTSGIYFKVTDEERALIEQKMALAGVRNMSAYIRKMCKSPMLSGRRFLSEP